MLEEPAEVGVVPGAGARRAAEVVGHRAAEQEPLHHPQQRRVVDLAREVLEEALELLDRAIGGRQELRRVVRAGLQALDIVELGDHLAAKALDPAANADRVAAFEAQPDPVGLAEHPGRERAGGVAELERQVGAAVARRQAVLPQAAVAALESPSRAQVGDRRGGSRSDCSFHASMVTASRTRPAQRSRMSE